MNETYQQSLQEFKEAAMKVINNIKESQQQVIKEGEKLMELVKDFKRAERGQNLTFPQKIHAEKVLTEVATRFDAKNQVAVEEEEESEVWAGQPDEDLTPAELEQEDKEVETSRK